MVHGHCAASSVLIQYQAWSETDCSDTFLVSRQDPDLDVGLGQGGDGLGDSVLQLVLDGRGPDQLDTHSDAAF